MDNTIIFNIALVIHMALTGLALTQLFKLKNTTGGVIIITFIALMIPILGPSGLIVYFKYLRKNRDKQNQQRAAQPQKRKNKKTT